MRNMPSVPEPGGCGELGLTHELVTTGNGIEAPVDPTEDERALGELAATIEGAIIPRLLLSHGIVPQSFAEAYGPESGIRADTVDAFVRVVMGEDAARPGEFVSELLSRGVSKEAILLELFGPAAETMGALWSADLCSFVDVTLGLARLHALMRSLGRLSPDDTTNGLDEVKGRVLLVPVPGEQHTLGLRIVEEFLLRDGWDVSSNPTADLSSIAAAVSAEWFDFVGLSASREALIDSLAEAISTIRKSSLNQVTRIMVGGMLFVVRPDLGAVLGVDGCCVDPREAVRMASPWARNGVAPKQYLS